jgi:DNA mismatch endonuclease (patch repair protein)
MDRSANMRAIRSKDMKPELAVRRLVHGMGYRYRLHRHDLPGRPDLVFPRLRKVIFVHGCFWHQHRRCRLAHAPRSNLGYWQPKLARTQKRDKKNRAALKAVGWDVLVVWECEVADSDLAARLHRFLQS